MMRVAGFCIVLTFSGSEASHVEIRAQPWKLLECAPSFTQCTQWVAYLLAKLDTCRSSEEEPNILDHHLHLEENPQIKLPPPCLWFLSFTSVPSRWLIWTSGRLHSAELFRRQCFRLLSWDGLSFCPNLTVFFSCFFLCYHPFSPTSCLPPYFLSFPPIFPIVFLLVIKCSEMGDWQLIVQ